LFAKSSSKWCIIQYIKNPDHQRTWKTYQFQKSDQMKFFLENFHFTKIKIKIKKKVDKIMNNFKIMNKIFFFKIVRSIFFIIEYFKECCILVILRMKWLFTFFINISNFLYKILPMEIEGYWIPYKIIFYLSLYDQ